MLQVKLNVASQTSIRPAVHCNEIGHRRLSGAHPAGIYATVLTGTPLDQAGQDENRSGNFQRVSDGDPVSVEPIERGLRTLCQCQKRNNHCGVCCKYSLLSTTPEKHSQLHSGLFPVPLPA